MDYTRYEQLSELAKPLQDFLMNHYTPHTEIVVSYDGVSVKESTLFTRIG